MKVKNFKYPIFLILIFLFFVIIACKKDANTVIENNNNFENQINGISFVSPPNEFPEENISFVENVGANWIGISPFAFSSSESSPNVLYDVNFQWWGERPEGVRTIIDYSRTNNLKIMLKPQVWIPNGWVGNYNPETEENWQTWEQDYLKYIVEFANIAQEKEVELFCIGTEYREAINNRPQFWNSLIDTVQQIYTGNLTYASNWDDYNQVHFWDKMEFIGIDSYFPLIEAATPEVDDLVAAWQPIVEDLDFFSKQHNKNIIFTEYGYMSVDYTAWQNWENEKNEDSLAVNLMAQKNSFEALYKSLWGKPWMKGGFIWKWYENYNIAGGENNKDYTPQRKPVEATIKNWYLK